MDRRSQAGPEPTTLEAVGNQWRYALVLVQAGDDDDDDDDVINMTLLLYHQLEVSCTVNQNLYL